MSTITKSQLDQVITDLWHISRTAIAGQEDQGRHARLTYVKKELLKTPELIVGFTPKRLWLYISDKVMPMGSYY